MANFFHASHTNCSLGLPTTPPRILVPTNVMDRTNYFSFNFGSYSEENNIYSGRDTANGVREGGQCSGGDSAQESRGNGRQLATFG